MRFIGRKTPYTNEEIIGKKCARCGQPAHAQWNICATGQYHPMCMECDISLNRLVLKWVNHPEATRLGADYESRYKT